MKIIKPCYLLSVVSMPMIEKNLLLCRRKGSNIGACIWFDFHPTKQRGTPIDSTSLLHSKPARRFLKFF